MLDLNFIEQNIIKLKENFKKRGFNFNNVYFQSTNFKIKDLKKKIYKLQNKHSLISSLVKYLKFNFMRFDFLLNIISNLKLKILFLKKSLDNALSEFNNFLYNLPNVLHKSVHFGLNENFNLEIRKFFSCLQYKNKLFFDLESNLNYIDFKSSSKISGTGFVFLKKHLAMIYRALGNYMLDVHIFKHGYTEINAPLLVKKKTMYSSGHLPKFENDLFHLSDFDLWLIPTAEVVLVNLLSAFNFDKFDLPLKYVAKTSCFRKEIGNYGSKVKGLIRQHQFDKVELVNIVNPSLSYNYLEELLSCAEVILQNLNLSYRIVSLCSKDIGHTSSKTYDIEVWFPKRKIYVEVSSCSNTESYQSVIMQSKIFHKKNSFYPHILNGSGLALGRVLLAMIEYYMDDYGNFTVPDVLVNYLNGLKIIKNL